MPARLGQAQRPGGGGTRHLPPHDVRDAGQLVLRRLLQARGDRVGVGTAARRLQAARRADVRHGLRGFGGGRRAVRRGGLRLLEAVPSRGPYHPREQARQFLGDGRDGALRSLLRDSFRPAGRGGDRRPSGPRDGQCGPSAGDRDMEPGLHAVQPQGQRFARGAAGAQCRYGHGLRAPLHDSAGQEVQLRYGRFPAYHRPHRGPFGQALRPGREVRRGHARHGRPPARHRLLDRRRAVALERQGGLRHPPHSAPRRALRLHLPRLHGAHAVPARRGAGGADGRAVPRTEGPADAHREGHRGGGVLLPAHAGYGYQPARRRHRAHEARGPRADFGPGCLRALRHVRFPDRPHGADRPRAGGRRGPGGLRGGVAGPEGAFAQRRGRLDRRLGGAAAHPRECLYGLRYADRRGPHRALPPRRVEGPHDLPAGIRPHAVLRQFGRPDRRRGVYRERRRAHRDRFDRKGERAHHPYRRRAPRESRGLFPCRRGCREAAVGGQQPYGDAPDARRPAAGARHA